jgi:5-formaminoimidazole-4-carboxamide-1-(beta)-D-ribofuranosyl 5'-monophosphate synthetase
MDGAKEEGFNTLAVCQRGRERPYKAFARIIDRIILLDKFRQLMDETNQRLMRDSNVIFIPHRSFTTYVDYDSIENEFRIPIFGSRSMLRTEERNVPRNQYFLLEVAGIKFPTRINSQSQIDRPVIVKVMEAKRGIERAFFTATSQKEFEEKAERRIKSGIITRENLDDAVIEELIIGTYFNFNFFYSPIKEEVEFLGIDRRLQTNLNDFVSLPASQQLEIDPELQNIEIGHMPATIRESMLEKVFEIGERFVDATKREYPPGIIGPFALQSAITKDLEIVVFDVSPRVPGSPVLAMSPYTHYYYGESFGTGRRIAIEIANALKAERLPEVVT